MKEEIKGKLNLINCTRNNHKGMIENLWQVIHSTEELNEREQDEINTIMAWIEEDLNQ